jgi:hypothetical protein
VHSRERYNILLWVLVLYVLGQEINSLLPRSVSLYKFCTFFHVVIKRVHSRLSHSILLVPMPGRTDKRKRLPRRSAREDAKNKVKQLAAELRKRTIDDHHGADDWGGVRESKKRKVTT